MRKTEKKENGYYKLKEGNEIWGEENGIRLVQIVGEYEDIIDELGVSLITLVIAFKNGIWSKGINQLDELYICPYFIDAKELEMGLKYDDKSKKHTLCLFKTENSENKNGVVRIKDYGKTWALTKEELE